MERRNVDNSKLQSQTCLLNCSRSKMRFVHLAGPVTLLEVMHFISYSFVYVTDCHPLYTPGENFWVVYVSYWVVYVSYWVVYVSYWVIYVSYWVVYVSYWVLCVNYWVLWLCKVDSIIISLIAIIWTVFLSLFCFIFSACQCQITA